MPLYVLDTNVLSRLARGVDRSIAEKVARHIVTHNVREFTRVPRLVVGDWQLE